VSKGSTLYYFATKEDLFLGALEWLVEKIHTRIREAVAEVDDPVDKMRRALSSVFANAHESRQFFLAYTDFVSIGTRNKRFHDLNARFYSGCCSLDREIIEYGIGAGAFRPVNPTDASTMVRALVDGFMLQWFFSSEGTFEDYHRRCERIVLDYLTGGQSVDSTAKT
jgi:AcrR family transcriptional regulator